MKELKMVKKLFALVILNGNYIRCRFKRFHQHNFVFQKLYSFQKDLPDRVIIQALVIVLFDFCLGNRDVNDCEPLMTIVTSFLCRFKRLDCITADTPED